MINEQLFANFSIKHKSDSYTHNGTLELANHKKINTPVVWMGLSIIESTELQTKIFKEAKIEAFLSNAFDLLYQDKKMKRHILIENLKQMGLLHKCDSGGFQLMKKPKINLDQDTIYKKQSEINPDIYVQLDYPLGIETDTTQNYKKIDFTINNLKTLLQKKDEKKTILPVIHGHDINTLEHCISEIQKYVESIPLIGIGSLVPKLYAVEGTGKVGNKWNFLELILWLRERLPNTFIHTFGVGGTMAYLCVLAGIDSYDSNGWIQKAAVEAIQLPGISDRFLEQKEHNRPFLISNRKLRNGIIVDEKNIFMQCKCPACTTYQKEYWEENDFQKKIKDFIGREEHNRYLRELHNIATFQSELLLMRNAIEYNKINEFILGRLKNSIYLKEADAIIEWKKGNKDPIQINLKENQKKNKYKKNKPLNNFI